MSTASSLPTFEHSSRRRDATSFDSGAFAPVAEPSLVHTGKNAGRSRPGVLQESRPVATRSRDPSKEVIPTPRSDTMVARRSKSSHTKLHKRAGSGSFSPSHSAFSTPYATYEEPMPNVSDKPVANKSSPAAKVKPYLRRMSWKEEAGKIDLSRPAAENESLTGLGIADFGHGSRSVTDLSFAHAGRRVPHNRSTSMSSQLSCESASLRPWQPFVHPMRQTPRPYTPRRARSQTSLLADGRTNDEEDTTAGDEYDLRQHDLEPWRTYRSASIPSIPQMPSTPRSISHTPNPITRLASASQTNLSIHSIKSSKSARLGRTRRSAGKSSEITASPSSRISHDKPFSFLSRGSDLDDPATRAAQIGAARRAFEEKEAAKERKAEKEELRRRDQEERKQARYEERALRKSETSERSRSKARKGKTSSMGGRSTITVESEKVGGREYADIAATHDRSLPVPGVAGGRAEQRVRTELSKKKAVKSRWTTSWSYCPQEENPGQDQDVAYESEQSDQTIYEVEDNFVEVSVLRYLPPPSHID
ncbi:hypothetical protein LTR66_014146 [Elasticomyces elasticus]|nr:hypothetical protein LTR66_014146 [Elasticomyces elasticus]